MTAKPFFSERPLATRHQRFVEAYLTSLKGTKAAIAAGYSPKTAKVQAARLLTKANVQAALEAANAERQRRTGVTAERVLRDIDTAANLDISLLFDEQGRLKPIHALPLAVRRAIVSFEVVRRNLTASDGTVEHIHKIKLIDKGKMQELLARHVGLFDGPVDDRPSVPAFVFTDCAGIRVQ